MKRQFKDVDFDCSLEELDSSLMWKYEQKQELKNRIFSDIDKLETQMGNNTNMKTLRTKKISLMRKLAYSGIAFLILFCLLIGSSFISPAMAEVVSNIPVLNQIFAPKKAIVEVITDELTSKGYKNTSVGVSFPKKEITISIDGTEKYFESVKDDVEKIAKGVLKSRDYNAYALKVVKYKERKVEVGEKEREMMKETQIIFTSVSEELKKHNYNVLQLSMSHNPKTIKLQIPNTETRSDEIKQIVEDALKANNINPIPIEIKKIDMKKREQDKRWNEIMELVGEDLLGKKEYKVRMMGYSVHPEPEIQAFITLPSSDKNAKDFAKRLEKVIDDFLKSDKMKTKIKNDPYHITIYSKDDKILN